MGGNIARMKSNPEMDFRKYVVNLWTEFICLRVVSSFGII